MSHGYLSDHSAKLCTGSTSRSLSVPHGHEFTGNGHMYQIALQRFTKEACLGRSLTIVCAVMSREGMLIFYL